MLNSENTYQKHIKNTISKTTTPPLCAQNICNHGGFTLIELTIAVVIIGLIVGGVVVGRDLIEASESKAIMSRLQQFEIAHQTFKTKYNCIAGDCVNASAFGLGTNGNGNTLLDNTCNTISAASVNMSATILNATPHMLRAHGECQMFWTHLSAAKLIKDSISELTAGQTTAETFFPTLHQDNHFISAFSWAGKTVFSTGLSTIVQPNDKEQYLSFISGSQAMYVIHKVAGEGGQTYDTSCGGGAGTNCAFPTDLLNKKAIPRGFRQSSVSYSYRYFSPAFTPTGATACISNSGSSHVYNMNGLCGIIWRID